MRLLKRLKKKPFCNDVHFLFIGAVLFLVSIKYYPFFVLLGIYVFLLLKKTRLGIPMSVLLLLFAVRISIIYGMEQIPIQGEITGVVYTNVKENSYTLWYKGMKIEVKEYNHENQIGDRITVLVTEQDLEEPSYTGAFDYKEYLLGKGITHYVKGKTTKRKNGISPYTLKYKYLNYLKENLSEISYSYVSTIVFADNAIDSEIKDSFSVLGISHILAISGMHILFLYKLFSFLLLKTVHYYKKGLPTLLVALFTISIGAPFSALRATLFLVIGFLDQKGELRYTKLDILSISGILMIFLNPYSAYQIGFILSYLVSFLLIFSSSIIEDASKLKKLYKTYFLIFLVTLPLTSRISHSISLASLALSPILSLVVTAVLLPISFLLAIFPILDIGFRYVFLGLNFYTTGLSKLALTIGVPYINIYMTFLYYVLLVFILVRRMRKKPIFVYSILLVLYFNLILNLNYLYPFSKVTFIGVGQGDSALVELDHERGTMLIDCYNAKSYLDCRGIKKIDILLITHSDSDHIGDYKEICSSIDVGKIYYPKTDIKCKELLKEYNATGLLGGDVFSLSEMKIQCVAPYNEYTNVNSNSLVVKFQIEGISYLFTGDMTKEEEEDVLAHKRNIQSDILKVGHHGSDTSTSIDFYTAVNPSVSIISVGLNNSYGLPKASVLSTLKDSKVYMTKDYGSITIVNRKQRYSIYTYHQP